MTIKNGLEGIKPKQTIENERKLKEEKPKIGTIWS